MIGQVGSLLTRYWKWAYPTGALYSPEEVDDMVNIDGYIPVANATELDALRNTTTQQMGDGTKWKGQYTTGVDKKYVIVNTIDYGGLNYTGFDSSGVFDGNNLLISNIKIVFHTKLFGLIGTLTGTAKNIKLEPHTNSVAPCIVVINQGTISNCEVNWTYSGYSILSSGSLCNSNQGTLEFCEGTINLSSETSGLGVICSNNYGLIKQSISKGNVTSESTFDFVGGLVSKNGGIGTTGALIIDCYSEVNVNGDRYVGGLVGFNYSGNTIENSFSIGAVNGNSNVGGFCGGNIGTITNCYWDTDTSGQTTSAGGTGKTTTEMQSGLIDDPDTDGIYVGWDDTIWDEVDNTSYPKLINVDT